MFDAEPLAGSSSILRRRKSLKVMGDFKLKHSSLLHLCRVIRRLVTLISAQAVLLAVNEASMRQAQSATDAAQSLLKVCLFVYITLDLIVNFTMALIVFVSCF